MHLFVRSTLAALALASPFAHAASPAACKPGQPIHDSGYVKIGGIEQWISIDGEDCGKPALLLVHGGPGNPLSIYKTDPYAAWSRDYVIVHWDQRATGMTWSRNAPNEDDPLLLPQMRDDGTELSRHLLQRLGKRKLVLLGSSWGSILGGHMAATNPELYCAWMPVAQVVNEAENVRLSRDMILARARAAGDGETLAKIEALGTPPWTNPRNFGIVRRAVRKYEAPNIDPTPPSWFEVLPSYASPQAKADYTEGEDYSFLKFVGWKGDGMASTMDLYRLGTRYELPVYLVQGTEDLLTEPKVTRRFFEAITAPEKALVEVPRAGHDPNGPLIDAQRQVLAERLHWRCD